MSKNNLSGLRAAIALIICSLIWPISAGENFSLYVDAEGNISFPEGFRSNMIHLGSWFVPEGDAGGFHDVYTEKETLEAFRNKGEFPDGSTLVKELRAANANTYTTGKNISHATSRIKQWFVMIKDSQGRFADNPVWGDGWGWALYKPGDTGKNLASNYKTDCLACHIPAKENDWIYVEAYPVLRDE